MTKKNKIGLLGCISCVLGNIIGTGIFVSPTSILRYCGGSIGLSLIVWLLSAVQAIIGGLTYVELGTSIPISGADISYADYVGFRPGAFLITFINILSIATSVAIYGVTFSVYLVDALPGEGTWCDETRFALTILFALVLILFISGVNVFRIDRYAVGIQFFSVLFKVGGLAALCVAGLVLACQGKASSDFQTPFANTSGENVGDFGLALYSGMWSYAGWDTLNGMVEEVDNPARTLPIAIVFGLLGVMGFYISVFCSLVAGLGVQGLLNAQAAAQSLTGLFATLIRDPDTLITMTSFFGAIYQTLSGCILLYIRFKHIPVHKDAIRMPLIIPILFLCQQVAVVAIPLYQYPALCAGGVGLVALGLLTYLLFFTFRKRLVPDWLIRADRTFLIWTQKTLLCVSDHDSLNSVLVEIRESSVALVKNEESSASVTSASASLALKED